MVIRNISKQIEQGVRISKIVACWCLVIATCITSFILMCLSYLLGDKESKRKQKSPGTAAAAQVVVMRELKWDHQVCTINFMISPHSAPVTQPLFAGCKESQFYSLPFEQAVASINLLASPKVISASPITLFD